MTQAQNTLQMKTYFPSRSGRRSAPRALRSHLRHRWSGCSSEAASPRCRTVPASGKEHSAEAACLCRAKRHSPATGRYPPSAHNHPPIAVDLKIGIRPGCRAFRCVSVTSIPGSQWHRIRSGARADSFRGAAEPRPNQPRTNHPRTNHPRTAPLCAGDRDGKPSADRLHA